MIQISEKTKQEIQERFTKYEIARILGARALQLAMNAPILLNLGKEDIEKINFDPLKIAELEFYAGVLPITVKRPLPPKREEKILPREKPKEVPEEVKEEKGKEEEKKEGKEGKGEEAEAEAKKGKVEEKKVEAAEKLREVEKDIIKEVEGSEIMEMARPQDEAEEETTEGVEE